MNRSTILIIAFATLVIIVSLGLILWILFRNGGRTERTEPDAPIPTRAQVSQEGVLLVRSILPPENTAGYPFSQRIYVTFDKPITPGGIDIEVSPPLPIRKELRNSGNELVIFPDPPEFWKTGVVYTITIKNTSKSVDGSVIRQNINYTIKAAPYKGGV